MCSEIRSGSALVNVTKTADLSADGFYYRSNVKKEHVFVVGAEDIPGNLDVGSEVCVVVHIMPRSRTIFVCVIDAAILNESSWRKSDVESIIRQRVDEIQLSDPFVRAVCNLDLAYTARYICIVRSLAGWCQTDIVLCFIEHTASKTAR